MTDEPPRKIAPFLGPSSVVIARSVGIVCIALGFVLGIQGLSDPHSGWLRTALALIGTGLVAQVYALYCALKRIQHLRDKQVGRGSSGGGEDEENR